MDKTGRPERILVLGVGNILMRDEGLGVRTIEYLQDRYSFPERVSLVDGGTGGLALLSVIRGFDGLIIVDALVSDTGPGSVHRVSGEKLHDAAPLTATAHQVGVRELLTVAALDGVTPEIVVLGMEPLEVYPGLELSDTVEKRLPELAGLVLKELETMGIDVKEKVTRA